METAKVAVFYRAFSCVAADEKWDAGKMTTQRQTGNIEILTFRVRMMRAHAS